MKPLHCMSNGFLKNKRMNMTERTWFIYSDVFVLTLLDYAIFLLNFFSNFSVNSFTLLWSIFIYLDVEHNFLNKNFWLGGKPCKEEKKIKKHKRKA